MRILQRGTFVQLITLFCFFLTTTLSLNCIKNCGMNGECDFNTGTCICSAGWGGDDCSLRMEEIISGQSISDQVATRMWSYYETTTSNNAISLTYYIQQENNGDCDLYVKAGSLPTKSYWDAKDTSIDSSFSVTVPAYSYTTYYAGVYGYRDCVYLISLSITTGSTCLNDCSGHGDCVVGVCSCDDSHYGPDCSSQIYELSEQVNSLTKSTTEENEWSYYLTRPIILSNTNNNNEIKYKPFYILFSQSEGHSTSGNYIYIKSLELPDTFNYDYRNGIQVDNQIVIGIGRPDQPLYYIAVLTSSISTFTLSISYEGVEECEEQCSSHGTCMPQIATCFCDDGYSGDACETLEGDMEDGEYYRGYAKNNVWNYYHFEGISQSNVVVVLNQLNLENGDSTDCDLYIQSSSLPTKQSFAYRDISTSNNISMIILNPMGITWYIGVYGFQLCSYDLMQTIQPRCPNDCSGKGECINQRCKCLEQWAGESCQYPMGNMEGVSSIYSSSIGSNYWNYFKYTVDEDISLTSVIVSLKEISSTGLIYLYLQRGSLPTSTDYIDTDTNQSSSIHSVSAIMTPDHIGNREFYIGVYGSSFIPINQSYVYKLGVYSPKITFD